MFQKAKVTWPKGADVSYEVRYSKGRKPFKSMAEAEEFAEAERKAGSWAEIAQIGRLVIEPKR